MAPQHGPSHNLPESRPVSVQSGAPSIPSLPTVAETDRALGRDIAPYERDVAERLTDRIVHSRKRASSVDSETGLGSGHALEQALEEASQTLRYNAKWFAEPGLVGLLKAAFEAAAGSSASVDLYAALHLVDVAATYAVLPEESVASIMRFLSYAYYQGSRMNKLRKLADQAWSNCRSLLQSHLGRHCVNELLHILRGNVQSKDDYAPVAGALGIVTDRLLYREDTEVLPAISATTLLLNLRFSTVSAEETLRDSVAMLLEAVLCNEPTLSDLNENGGWDVFLDLVERCAIKTPVDQAVRALLDEFSKHIPRLEQRHLPQIAEIFVRAKRPLHPAMTKELLQPWAHIVPSGDLPPGLDRMLRSLSRSLDHLQELDYLVQRTTKTLILQSIAEISLQDKLDSLESIILDRDSIPPAANIISNALVELFRHVVRHNARNELKLTTFGALCNVSTKCTNAAEVLFDLHTDATGQIFLKQEAATTELAKSKQSSLEYNAIPVPLAKLDKALLRALAAGEGVAWEVFDLFLTKTAGFLGNHTMFEDRIETIKQVGVLCGQYLKTNSYQEPPVETGLTKSYVALHLIQILTAVTSYHRFLSKPDMLSSASIFLSVAGSRDYAVSIHCIHALTICCYELPDLMSSYMEDIIDKMSKMVTQRYLAIHVLQFLAGLSRLPDLFRNFQTHDYKKIFGVCGSYLQFVRSSPPSDSHQTHNQQSDGSSRSSTESTDALPQYVYALAHHVIAFWYLALKVHDRSALKSYITSCVRYKSADGHDIIEDPGLVTIDMMDSIDAEETAHTEVRDFDTADGRRVVQHRLAGLLLISTETALRTGRTIVTVRRASATAQRMIANGKDSLRHSVTFESTDDDYFSVIADDGHSSTYGKVYYPRASSVLGSARVSILPEDDAVTRAIQSLDRTSALDSHKAGVIYIGENQSREDIILQNVMGSPDYDELLSGLGTIRELRNATWNTQGLDRMDDVDGKYAVVWHYELTSIVYHVTTMMPNTDEPSMTMANKKRHIGNDFVNIVFNNSGLPFDFNTFPSQFACVYIVVTPCARSTFIQTRVRKDNTPRDRFYNVRVVTRPSYPTISSAAESKCISGASLPTYVRNLALNECVFSSMWQSLGYGGEGSSGAGIAATAAEYPSSWRSRLMQLRRMRERWGGK